MVKSWLILHNITIGYTLAIGVAVGIVLVVGNVRPGRQLTRWDELVHDVTEGGMVMILVVVVVMVIMLMLNWGSDGLGSSDGNGDGDGLGGAGNDADVTEGWESRSRE